MSTVTSAEIDLHALHCQISLAQTALLEVAARASAAVYSDHPMRLDSLCEAVDDLSESIFAVTKSGNELLMALDSPTFPVKGKSVNG